MRRGIVFLAIALCSASLHGAISTTERNALLALYVSTNGDNWTNRTGWNGAAGTECTWFGIRCNGDSSAVDAIGLSFNNLTGTLPPQIGDFPSLTELSMFGNAIGGAIPAQVGNLTKLDRLELYSNRFTGTIPSSLGNLTSVTFFALGDNQIGGSIPLELGNLARVEFFSFNGDLLNGPIPPELGRLRSVRVIDLAYNQIGGSIPGELGQLSTLVELDLNNNRLTGAIPIQLGQLSALETLAVGINQLSGSIPPQLGNLANLHTLSLGINQLSGTIPVELANLANLEKLSLEQNALSGSLPPELARLTALVELTANANQLSGPIPRELGSLTKLERLNLETNQFGGAIPRELGNLANLRVLSVGHNQLIGTLPSELTNLSNLVSLSFESNQVTGPLPIDIARLQKLEELIAFDNRLSGTIPDGITSLLNLRQLLLGGNQLTGTIPPAITNLASLTFLDLRGNDLTGPLPLDLDRMQKLENISVFGNRLSGAIPDSITRLPALTILRIEDNEFTGTVPPQISNLKNLQFLGLRRNHFEGTIPASIGTLTELRTLWLGGNRLEGAIPAELGALSKLMDIDLGNNQLSGPVPIELTNLANLADGLSDFRFNRLFTTDTAVRSFLNRTQDGGDWESSQTLPPSNVRFSEITDRSAIVTWDFPAYTSDDGGYQVTLAAGSGTVVVTTASKLLPSILARGLSALTTYSVTVRTVTAPHGLQQNTLTSDPTSAVSFSTLAFTLAPASVELTTAPSGLFQSGSDLSEDSFTLTNRGDVPTDITLSVNGTIFGVTPSLFTLSGGGTQDVSVTILAPQPPGAYSGEVIVQGTGIESFTIPLQLLSVTTGGGAPTVQAGSIRLDLTGDGTTNIDTTIAFANNGTSTLSGIVVSDVPWIVVPPALVTIAPGSSANVMVTIVPSRLPDGEGALDGAVRLLYNAGSTASASSIRTSAVATSSTRVTVSYTSKPAIGSAAIPPLVPGEVARFIPGIVNRVSGARRMLSDLFVSNAFGVGGIRDLKVYLAAAQSSTAPTVASFGRVEPAQSLQLANVVGSVYSSSTPIASLVLRTIDWDKLLVHASFGDLAPDGARGGFVPVFRSDRAVAAGQEIALPGVRADDRMRTTLYIQETSGNAATITIEVLDASGQRAGDLRKLDLQPYAMAEVTDAIVPAGKTAIVTTSAGRIVAYAAIDDIGTGDRWTIVDWSRFYAFEANQAASIAFVQGAAANGRRRAAGHSSLDPLPEATAVKPRSEVSLFNEEATATTVALSFYTANGGTFRRDVSLAPRETKLLSDVASFVGGGASGSLTVTPVRGRIGISSRAYNETTSGTFGSAVPIRSATTGLRRGQRQIFAGIEDAAAQAASLHQPGTYRTGAVFVETDGKPVTVRTSLSYSDARTVSTVFRDYTVPAHGFLNVDNLPASVLGTQRDKLGDLHNLQITFDISGGDGAASIVLISTENATGDTNIRVE